MKKRNKKRLKLIAKVYWSTFFIALILLIISIAHAKSIEKAIIYPLGYTSLQVVLVVILMQLDKIAQKIYNRIKQHRVYYDNFRKDYRELVKQYDQYQKSIDKVSFFFERQKISEDSNCKLINTAFSRKKGIDVQSIESYGYNIPANAEFLLHQGLKLLIYKDISEEKKLHIINMMKKEKEILENMDKNV